LQNWHLYFFSGASDAFRTPDAAALGRTDTLAGMAVVLTTRRLGGGSWTQSDG
jgi:hypothetical protein